MGFSSQPGQVGFGIQTLKGTPVAATRFARLRSGSLGADRTLMVPDPEIGGNRDIPSAYLGPVGFSGDLEFYARMQMLPLLLKAALGQSSSSNVAGTNEVQSVNTSGAPTGGTFRLKYRGSTTATIAFNATATAVDTALEALPGIGVGGVLCAGGPIGTAPVTVTFNGAGTSAQNVPPITLAENLLTGGTNPSVTISTTTAGVDVIGTHVITPTDAIPWITVEERVSTGFESFRYTDGKVNTLHLEAEATGYLMGTAGIAALTQSSGFSAQASPAWDTTPMVVGSQIGISFAGATLPVKSFSFDVANNIETDDFIMGSLYAADMVEKRREVKAGVTYRPQDSTLWKAAMYGTTGVTVPQAGPAYRGPMTITIATFETIGDVVAGTPYSLVLDTEDAVIAPFKVSPSGDDVIQNDLEITFIRDDPLVPIVTATVKNNLATVA